MPKISVIIPTYNREAYIEEAIESVFNQTYTDWELIILDDGSTDNTAQIIKKYGDKIHYHRQENAGETAARNAGFKYATGEYLTFLDSDDYMLRHNLECLAEILDNDKTIDIAYGWYYWVNTKKEPFLIEHSKILGDRFPKEDSPWPNKQINPDGTKIEGKIFSKLIKEETMLMGSTLIRRKCFEAVDGFTNGMPYQGHWEFYLRVAYAGFVFKCVKRPVIMIRVHPNNQAKNVDGMLKARLKILDKYFKDSLPSSLSQKDKNEAYYEAYIAEAKNYFASNNFEKVLENLQNSLKYLRSLQRDNDLDEIADLLLSDFYRQSPEDPSQIAEDTIKKIGNHYQTKYLRKIVFGKIYAELAFKNRWYNPKNVVNFGSKAILNDSVLLQNRGLLRIITESLISEQMIGFLKQFRFPLDQSFIEKKSQKKCVFLSPHFDDAILSCGGLITGLSRKKAEILIVTIFTKDPTESQEISVFAKELHDLWELGDKPFEGRKKEEIEIMKNIQGQFQWLEFQDVMYRYPELRQVNDQLITGFKPQEDKCFQEAKKQIEKIFDQNSDCVFFSPLGLGNHPDHLIINQITLLLQQSKPDLRIFYYEDFPYAQKENYKTKIQNFYHKAKSVNIDITDFIDERIRLSGIYKSQLECIFNDPENIGDEIKRHARNVGTFSHPQERYWY